MSTLSMVSKPSVLINVFQPDEGGCFEALRAFCYAWKSDLSILVVNDKRFSVSEEFKQKLKDNFKNIEIVDSTVDRKGNLNGIDFIREQFRWMTYLQQKTNSEWIFKLDSDFLLVHPEIYTDLMVRPFTKAVFPTGDWLKSHTREHNGWGLGICYTLRYDAIASLEKLFSMRQTFCYGEDYEISTSARLLYGEGVGLKYIFCNGMSIRPFQEWDNNKKEITEDVEMFKAFQEGIGAFYFGNRGETPPTWVIPENPEIKDKKEIKFVRDENRIRKSYGERMNRLNNYISKYFSNEITESLDYGKYPNVPDIDGKIFEDLHKKQHNNI